MKESLFVPYKIYPEWLCEKEADYWFNIFLARVKWDSPLVKVYGKQYAVPRLTSFIARPEINYSYSGFKHDSFGIPIWILPLLERVNVVSGVEYNGILLNRYRDGNDHMGWHSDNEPELDSSKPITSLSLGVSRDFIFKNKKNSDKEKILLNNGDLLIMNIGCQDTWLHCLPKRRNLVGERINLTFRRFI